MLTDTKGHNSEESGVITSCLHVRISNRIRGFVKATPDMWRCHIKPMVKPCQMTKACCSMHHLSVADGLLNCVLYTIHAKSLSWHEALLLGCCEFVLQDTSFVLCIYLDLSIKLKQAQRRTAEDRSRYKRYRKIRN